MKTMRKTIRLFALAALSILALGAAVFTVSGLGTRLAGEMITPSGTSRSRALYLTMRDGVGIAVDVWLPPDLRAGQRVPALVRAGRYGRSYRVGFAVRSLIGLGLIDEKLGGPVGPGCLLVDAFNRAGYAVVLVDVRGSGASSGERPVMFHPDEIEDLREVIDWTISRPWSDGRVGAFGTSYAGTAAEMIAALGHPAVRAVAPRFSAFDVQREVAWPGGVFNRAFTSRWGRLTRAVDANDACRALGRTGMDCLITRLMTGGVKPVDEDSGGRKLAELVSSRNHPDPAGIAWRMEYRDSRLGPGGISARDVSPFGRLSATERSGVPMLVMTSWLDAASADGALSRYLTIGNPQTIVIGAWSHGGLYDADPFLPAGTPTDFHAADLELMHINFFDRHIKGHSRSGYEPGIVYYTMGEGRWKRTQAWPPPEASTQTWYFGPAGTLTNSPPNSDAGADEYLVDFSATTGRSARWMLLPVDTVYPDRAQEDKKLLAYTSAPMQRDTEITGSPVVTLQVSSTHQDGAFFAYLEDVAPDGRVTYITEGILRAIHPETPDQNPAYVQLGPYHSFKSDDAAPAVSGDVHEVKFKLFSTSVLIRKGHSIRVAIAGHDAAWFDRYPRSGTPTLKVSRNRLRASRIDLPVVARPQDALVSLETGGTKVSL